MSTNSNNNGFASNKNTPTPTPPTLKKLSGVIERITFHSEETGYTVARLLPDSGGEHKSGRNSNNSGAASTASPRRFATKGEDNLVTVVGTMNGVAPGEALELTGLWQQHPQHGWQFKTESYRSVLPATEQGIRKYLGSGLIKGIGPKTADKIVAFLGVDTLTVLEEQPDRLNEVPKLGQHKAGLIAAAWVEQKAIKEVMVFLQGNGISTSLAVRIYKQYGDAATTIVKNEPYRLAREVYGIGFKTADKIATNLGFSHEDPERIKAGTLFVLSEASDSGGHTYLPRPVLAEKAAELLGVEAALVEEAITGLALDGGAQVETLVADPDDGSLFFKPLVAVTVFNGSSSKTAQPVLRAAPVTATPQTSDKDEVNEDIDPLEQDLNDFARYSPVSRRSATSVGNSKTSASASKSSSNNNSKAGAGPARSLNQAGTHNQGVNAAGDRSGHKPPAPAPVITPASVSSGFATNPDLASGREVYQGATPTLSALPGEQAVYLPPFYWAEVGIARQLLRLAHCTRQEDRLSELANTNFPTMFEYLATKDEAKLVLADRQKEGVVAALARPVAVLTGGPGTGKTTSMKALIRALSLKKKRVILAAPTGRAAKRLSEATGLEAKTLHRLLALKPGGKSQYDAKEGKPIEADIVIVDEVSMLDTLLMYSLLKGIATGTHLLLVGDADQLPSVGAGNVLSDIINSEVVPVVRLDQIFRQGAGSAIVTNAHRINQGQMPLTGEHIKDFFFFTEDDPELAGDLVVDLVAQRIPKKFGFRSEDIQVLAPMHRGKSGVGYLNEKLQETLNAPSDSKPQKQYGSKVFRVGDKVLQLRNNYDKQVYNGDGGTIIELSLENQTVKVKLEDDREVEYDFGELDELTLAYAVSIHKSQGSEYPVVVVPVAMGHYMLLERKLIYTAVTRAKKLVVMVGSKKALAMAVRNGPKVGGEVGSYNGSNNPAHRAGRYTGLAIRLAQLS